MEVRDLTNSQGILPLRLGTARAIKNYNNLVHIIKLETYKDNIDRIANSLTNFDNFDGPKDSITITRLKLKELENKLESLTPKLRNKRGLINGLGTAIKFITGNMDANDAQKLNKEIESLISNQTELREDMNSQIRINSQMIKRFENITNHINKEQDTIENFLKRYQEQVRNRIRVNEDILFHTQYLNQINYNIDLLTNHVTNIAEAMVLARLNIIPKLILNPSELEEIYNILSNQSIEVRSNEHIYELLGLQAYYNGSNIIFNIRIPILSHDNYSLFHIIPLPLNETKEIITKPYIISNTQHIQYLNEICPKIEGIFYCEESTHQEQTNKSTCIGRLMNNEPAQCTINDIGKIEAVLQPEPNYILLLNIPSTPIRSNCGNSNQMLQGTILLHYEDCEVEINGVIYKDNPNIFWDEVHIFPPFFNSIQPESTIETLNMQKLKEYHFKNKEAIDILKIETQKRDNITYLSVVALGIIIIIGITYTFRKFTVTLQINKSKDHVIAPTPSTSQFLWPSLHAKGGGVTDAHTT